MLLLPSSGRQCDGLWSGMGHEAILRILGECRVPTRVPVEWDGHGN